MLRIDAESAEHIELLQALENEQDWEVCEPEHSDIKVTLCNNLTLFEIWFYRHLVLVPSSKFILIAYGHVKDR